MLDIENRSMKEFGSISRPFSSQLKARTLGDTITEFIASRAGKIQAIINKYKIKKENKNG